MTVTQNEDRVCHNTYRLLAELQLQPTNINIAKTKIQTGMDDNDVDFEADDMETLESDTSSNNEYTMLIFFEIL